MTQLSKDYADEIAKLAPHRRQTWRNVLTLAAMIVVPLVVAGFLVGISGGLAWVVGLAIVRWLS